MKKKEFISKVTDVLKDNDIRKSVSIKKHTFHITDNDGNAADFTIKQQDKRVLYTVEDISSIIDACIAVIVDAIKHGDTIFIKGFGTLSLKRREARRTKQPGTEEWCEVEARYVPKFSYGNDLRMAARIYEMSLEDSQCAEEDLEVLE